MKNYPSQIHPLLIAANRAQLAGFTYLAAALVAVWRKTKAAETAVVKDCFTTRGLLVAEGSP